jgi:hypothetical protein
MLQVYARRYLHAIYGMKKCIVLILETIMNKASFEFDRTLQKKHSAFLQNFGSLKTYYYE